MLTFINIHIVEAYDGRIFDFITRLNLLNAVYVNVNLLVLSYIVDTSSILLQFENFEPLKLSVYEKRQQKMCYIKRFLISNPVMTTYSYTHKIEKVC